MTANATSRTAAPRRARQAGFTLLELLVALVLLSLVFLIIGSALQFGMNASRGREGRSDSSEILVTQGFLRRLLSEIRPAPKRPDPGETEINFSGSGSAMHFVSTMPGQVGVAGLYEVSLYLVPAKPGDRLELSWRLLRPPQGNNDSAGLTRHEVLATDVNQIQFSYFGQRGAEPGGRWYGQWDHSDRLPDLIQLRVSFTDASRVWPDLIVAPMIRSMKPVIDPDRMYY